MPADVRTYSESFRAACLEKRDTRAQDVLVAVEDPSLTFDGQISKVGV